MMDDEEIRAILTYNTIPPLFGGWTPSYNGDPCMGGHTPQSTHKYGTKAYCGRCERQLDLRRCLCGEETHRGGLARSFCPNRMRFDQRDAETHANLIALLLRAQSDS